MESSNTDQENVKVKLIFNPGSGINDKSPVQLMDVIKEMQALKFMPEAYLLEPESDLVGVVRDSIAQGINMFVVCGGDGTISAVTSAMIGSDATLGIIPTGTQNNIALSLGIPTDIQGAIGILRTGERLKVDIGIVTSGDVHTPFIEVCSVGLFTTLFPSGDDIQHGDITRIGDFVATLTTSPPSEIHLSIDDEQEIKKLGHVVLISNMPYVGRHYQVGALDSFNDGLLDVLFFADLSKLDLLNYVIKGPGKTELEDNRIQHFRVRKVTIDTHPSMPILADSVIIGEGLIQIEVKQQALAVMVGPTVSNMLREQGEILEK